MSNIQHATVVNKAGQKLYAIINTGPPMSAGAGGQGTATMIATTAPGTTPGTVVIGHHQQQQQHQQPQHILRPYITVQTAGTTPRVAGGQPVAVRQVVTTGGTPTASGVTPHQQQQQHRQQQHQMTIKLENQSNTTPNANSNINNNNSTPNILLQGSASAQSANNSTASGGGGGGGGSSIKRRKQDPKTGKGLRHFSMKVCEKVRQKGTTTYNEVADELVAEFSADPIASRAALTGGYVPADAEPFDQKNIRRRVYDALNVLMAMNIISKEKKEIKWIGLPTNAAQEVVELSEAKSKLEDRIRAKRAHLQDLLLQHIAFKNLVDRNRAVATAAAAGAGGAAVNGHVKSSTIALPFIVVNTDKKTVIDCSISNDKTEYLFNFDAAFEIHDDAEILKMMGFAHGLERRRGQTAATTTLTATAGQEPDSTTDGPAGRLNAARASLPEALREEFDLLLKEQTAAGGGGGGARKTKKGK